MLVLSGLLWQRHKPEGLERQALILSLFWRLEVKITVSQGPAPPEAPAGLLPGLFLLLLAGSLWPPLARGCNTSPSALIVTWCFVCVSYKDTSPIEIKARSSPV